MAHRALITGASGFVGECLTRKLLKNGWQVHLILRQNSNLDGLSDLSNLLTIHRTDGSFTSIESAVKNSQPDVVFHLASLFLAQHQPQDINNLIESNILFPNLLLEAMHHCGIRNLVNTGTSWQHYQDKEYCPVNLYAATKDAFERLITYYVDAHDFKINTLKLFDTYGPGDKRKKIFYLLRNAARSGQAINMSPGEQKINLVYGEDVAEAYILAGKSLIEYPEASNETYGIAGKQSISLRELVKVYCEVTNLCINVKWGALPYRTREMMIPWSKFKPVPHWSPETSLEKGIVQMETDNSIQGLLVKN